MDAKEPKQFVKGASATKQGRVLEQTILPCLQSYGFQILPFREWKKSPSSFGSELVLKNVPFTTIYGHPGYTEFLLRSALHTLEVRIECKWQQSGGSVDEKLPYLYLNCLEAMPEKEIIIVAGGGGMKKGALSWLKTAVRDNRYIPPNAARKTIHVFSLDEFLQWANSVFRR